ncbi:hypothetical protein L3X38_040654 [Prunus dulcis]|uniref:Uncharacterized protein n=1 Tax=Prunus dulcis TaxID=3755 RepID=A0AAD4YTM1_PRUDU|nr:hypothetical protein L3X38_040654 [Prunus dulcis]
MNMRFRLVTGFSEDMCSRVDYVSPEFWEDMHSRADHVSLEFYDDATYMESVKKYLVHVLTYGLNFVSCIKNYVPLDPSLRVRRQPRLTEVQSQVL